jgi:hypothetical protein
MRDAHAVPVIQLLLYYVQYTRSNQSPNSLALLEDIAATIQPASGLLQPLAPPIYRSPYASQITSSTPPILQERSLNIKAPVAKVLAIR